MPILMKQNSAMGSSFNEFKRQASFFLKEKIKTARLKLTDVTPAQLLTEEATNGDTWPQDTRIMGLISRAAFEIDDYWRIVDILHKRLMQFDRNNWRASYKVLLLLEHLLTHGPQSVAEEFQSDKHVVREMLDFQYIDERGFNWGMSVKKLAERVLDLLENDQYLKEERTRARKLTHGIKGFGSFCHHPQTLERTFDDPSAMKYGRCNSENIGYENTESSFSVSQFELYNGAEDRKKKELKGLRNIGYIALSQDEYCGIEDHPFSDSKDHRTASLLSPLIV